MGSRVVMTNRNDVLLDTHVLLWLMNGDSELSVNIKDLIKEACKESLLFVSAISFWEIALLESKGRISLNMPVDLWAKKILSLLYVKVIDLNHNIAIESCKLPGEFHGDPADRMIVATSRLLNLPLLTRDQKILDYSSLSFIKAIKC